MVNPTGNADLCPTIPNDRRMECLQAVPELANMNRVTVRTSLSSLSLALGDEDEGRLIRFTEAEARGLLT